MHTKEHLLALLQSNKSRLATLQINLGRDEIELSDVQIQTMITALDYLTVNMKMVLEDNRNGNKTDN